VALSLPRGTVTATWHDVSLTRGKILIFLKILKKLIKNQKEIKKKFKKKNKKISKNPEADTWHPINTVTPPLTERT